MKSPEILIDPGFFASTGLLAGLVKIGLGGEYRNLGLIAPNDALCH